MLPAFEYHRVTSIGEAVKILKKYPTDAKVYAGGTDLLLELARGKASYKHLVSLKKVPGLGEIGIEGDYVVLGANVTHTDVQNSSLVNKRIGALADAVCRVGSMQVRNVATVVGNICNAAPSADTASPLLVLDAVIKVIGGKGERRIKLSNFYKGPGKTCLASDETVLAICFPVPPINSASAYIKLQKRKAMDLALIGVAANVQCNSDKQVFSDVKIAMSTVAPTPIRAYGAEKVLKGQPITQLAIIQAAEAAAIEASPRTSWRSTAEYRRQMIRVLVQDAIKKALKRLDVPNIG